MLLVSAKAERDLTALRPRCIGATFGRMRRRYFEGTIFRIVPKNRVVKG
jgi:hypothetical protein